MPISWRVAAAGLDAATATCAAFNLAYFARRLIRWREETTARAVAVVALAIVSLGAAAESLFFLTSMSGAADGGSPAWAAVRALPLAGSAIITVLIVRRVLAAVWPEDPLP